MERDDERLDGIRAALRQAGLDALVCALPANVLLLSGYWPVVGTSLALVTRDRSALLVPEGERSLAADGWADEVLSFEPGSVKDLRSATDAVGPLLAEVGNRLFSSGARIGLESGQTYEPASYAALHLYGNTLSALLARIIPSATLYPADDVLAGLRATLPRRSNSGWGWPAGSPESLSRPAGGCCARD
jgi:Xaa-Pro aminopeptidase